MNDEMLRRLGIEEQALQGLVDERILAAGGGAAGHPRGRRDAEAARRHRPRVPAGRPVPGRRPRSGSGSSGQGVTVKEFEDSFRNSILRERLVALVTDSVHVSPAEAEKEFRRRNEQVKAEYVVVTADNAGLTATDDEVRARFEANKDAYKLPERRVLSYVLVDAPSLASRVTAHRSRPARVLRGAPRRVPAGRRSCARATSWSRSRRRRTRRTGTPTTTRGGSRSPRWTRSGSAPTSPRWRSGSRRTRARPRRAATSAASRAGAWCPSSTTRPLPWTRARCRTWCGPTSATTSSRPSRARTSPSPPSRRSRSRSGRA